MTAATDAELFLPVGLAMTADGGFLIADSADNVVRKVTAAGVIPGSRGPARQEAAGMTARPPTPNSTIPSGWR